MKKIFFTALTALAASLAMTSCDGVIFSTIRDEVELTDAQISGDIHSMVRFGDDTTEYLYVTNGNIWRKDITAAAIDKEPTMAEPYNGQWSKTGKPSGHVVKLASDSTYLYALSYTVEEVEDDGENQVTAKNLYCSSDGGDSWTRIDIQMSSSNTDTILFCTNTPKPGSRKAFLYYAGDGNTYTLDGSEATVITGDTSGAYTFINDTTAPSSAAYMNDVYYLSSSYTMTSDETRDNDAGYIYYTSSDDIHYSSDGENWSHVSAGCGTIYCLSLTSDSFILGTSDGIEKIAVEDSIPISGTQSFRSNASSTLSSYYEVWYVLAANPELTESGGDLYGTTDFSGSSSSTSATFSNVGLWAYYPGRAKWNRE